MSFPQYPSYVDSGVEWWGDMPREWGLFPAKRFFARKKELNSGMKCENRLSLTLGGVVPRSLNDLDGLQASEFETYQIFCADDLVFKLIDLQNIKTSRVGLVPETGIMSPAYIRVEPNKSKVVSKFAYWFFTNLYNRCIFNELGGGVRQTISSEELLLLPYPALPCEEQTIIAAFLDRETDKIDKLVAEQRRLMELLKVKRQAVISHAVTRGVNPAAPLKPSGTFWFDEIPQHWTVGPLKHFWEVIDCKHITVPFLDEGIPVASILEVRSFILDLSQAEKTSEEAFNLLVEGDRQPRRGDVIYCRNTANTGTSAYVATEERIALGQDVCLIKSSAKNGRYLNYVLHSTFMASELETLMVGSTFKRINVAQIRGLIVPCPPLEEQESIASYLDNVSTKFDTLTAEAQRAIDLLQERRTALISAAVTGQIDVRTSSAASLTLLKPFASGFARQLLAAEVLHHCHQHPTTGRVKLQKLIHLCEHVAELEEVGAHYARKAAGPYDNKMMYGIAKGLSALNWFSEVRDGQRTFYRPLEKAGEHQKYLAHWESKLPKIRHVLKLLGKAETQQCEIVSTLYAAWNDLLIEGKSPSDKGIIFEASDAVRWHESKTKIPAEKWPIALQWMREKGLIPKGFGNHTKAAVSDVAVTHQGKSRRSNQKKRA